MLESLHIQNIVLIEKLAIAFQSGFCTLTGETGAGKSILLDALGLALGVRAEAGLVRKGADQAMVSACFDLPEDHPAADILKEQGLSFDRSLVLRRTLSADGRSRAYINDQPVSVGLLRAVGDSLVEIHGQFQTQGLLDAKTHRGLLDEYAGIDREKLARLWRVWQDAETALQKAQEGAAKARAEEEYLRTAVEDLDALAPREGEEEGLATLRRKLMNRDQIMTAFQKGGEGIEETLSHLYTAWRALEKAGEDSAVICEGLGRVDAELKEVVNAIQSASADLDESASDLPRVDNRLFDLRAQARKHDCSVDDLAGLLENLRSRLFAIEREDEMLDELRAARTKAKESYIAAADEAAQKRRTAATELDKRVAAELPPLKLGKAQFVTDITDLPEESWGPSGRDQVRFLIATNPGSALGPLHKIASGGEMSRFMLALKVVMAAVGSAGTYIFDEVDSGIGGPTAAAVGERLAKLAENRQILVVTHAPQVAARASYHYIVQKDAGEVVKTTIVPLEALGQRQEEIARMLAGAEITDEARAAAHKLLETGS